MTILNQTKVAELYSSALPSADAAVDAEVAAYVPSKRCPYCQSYDMHYKFQGNYGVCIHCETHNIFGHIFPYLKGKKYANQELTKDQIAQAWLDANGSLIAADKVAGKFYYLIGKLTLRTDTKTVAVIAAEAEAVKMAEAVAEEKL